MRPDQVPSDHLPVTHLLVAVLEMLHQHGHHDVHQDELRHQHEHDEEDGGDHGGDAAVLDAVRWGRGEGAEIQGLGHFRWFAFCRILVGIASI